MFISKCALSLYHQKRNTMKLQSAIELKPSKNEISHIQTMVVRDGKKMTQNWSVYFSNGKYNLSKGLIFNERQSHEVLMSTSFEKIASFLGK